MKEAVISTERLNSYGTRVLTEGIDLSQYEKNPVLLYMHRRGRREDMPIGKMTNLRKDGATLYGTPEFDQDTEEERNIAKKWERGTLRMLSAGLDIVEWSDSPELLVQGQTRPTITRSKLIEVSVVDIGANDDALQVGLYRDGALLTLATGEDSGHLPLLKSEEERGMSKEGEENEETENRNNKPQENNREKSMEKIMMKLGLAADAGEEQAVEAIGRLQEENEKIALGRITDAVDAAIKEKKLGADKKERYVGLGKKLGLDALNELLADLKPVQKPLDLVNKGGEGKSGKLTWKEASPEQLAELKAGNREEYIRLYKEEYGFAPEL